MRNSLLFSFAAVGAAVTIALPASAAAAAATVAPLSLVSEPSPFAGCTGGLDPGSPPGTNYVNAEVEPFIAVDPASALAMNVHRVGHAALGFGRPQRCWRSLRMRARSRRWAARTSGWRAWALRQRR